MALITSAQSGNWTSTSTWTGGSVPADGDQFEVQPGHAVVINSDVRTTNGYHDSYVEGKLSMTTNGKLLMNGTLLVRDGLGGSATGYFSEGDANSGPHFRMENGSHLEITGDNSANHALRGETHKYVWIECEGTDPRPKTTLSADETIGSSVLNLTSASNFRAGDWIHIYVEAEQIADWEREKAPREESFIIHDISSNNVYFRQFVTPTATISRVGSSKIFVDDSTVFRVGQKIIFGTGSNRNIKTISSIGKGSGRITVDSAITGTVTGETVYLTGCEKWHKSGDSVQVMATPLTAGGTSGSRTIQVANPNGFSVGDRVLIEANNNSDTNWDYVMDNVVESISGNSLVLVNNLANNRSLGAWVVNFERDTQIKAKTPDLTGTSSERPYVWIEHWTSGDAYYRRIRFRNVGFYGIGSNTVNSSYYRGVGMNRCSYETNTYGNYTSGLEGCVWHPNNSGSNSCMYWRESHYQRMSRNVCYNGHLNFWRWSSGNEACMTANISWRSQYCCFYMDGFYEPRTCFAYNHASRSDDYGMFIYHGRDHQVEVRHNYFTHHENRPFYWYYQTQNFLMDRNYFNYYRYWPHVGRGGGDVIMLNSYLGNGWDSTGGGTTVTGVYVHSDSLRPDRNGRMSRCTSVNHNFKEGATVEWAGHHWKEWNDDEEAWFYRRSSNNDSWAGDTEELFVPAGATVYCAAEVKLTSGNNGTKPFLMARSKQQYNYGKFLTGPTDTSESPSEENPHGYPMGHFEKVDFTSACETAYERKTLTISPVNYDYYIVVAVVSSNRNLSNTATEGWYQKPIELYINKSSPIKEKKFLTSHQSKRGINNSTVRRKKRLGGRLV